MFALKAIGTSSSANSTFANDETDTLEPTRVGQPRLAPETR
jgi:hypothetical protein